MTRPDAQSHAPIHGGTPWTWVPWHVAEGPSEVRCAEGWLVCTTSSDDHARLIAAAPDLLTVAELAVELRFTDAATIHEFQKIARIAIAKATGLPSDGSSPQTNPSHDR